MLQTEQHFSLRGYNLKPSIGVRNEKEAKKLSI